MNDLRGLAVLALLAAACGKGEGGNQAAPAPAPSPPTAAADAAVVAAPVADAAAPAVDAGVATATLTIGDCVTAAAAGRSPGTQLKLPGVGTGNIGLGPPGIRPPYDPTNPLGPGPAAQRARLTEGLISVGPGLDKDVVRRYVRRYRSRHLYCYEKALQARPDLGGGVAQIQFTVVPSGQVVSVAATGMDRQLGDCLVAGLRAMTLPKPADGAAVPVKMAFTFEPPPGSPSAPPARKPVARPDPVALTAALRARTDGLRACLPPQALGSATLQLALDRSGTVVNAKVVGMPDAAVAACLVAAAKGAVGKPGAQGSLRCPLSFGGG